MSSFSKSSKTFKLVNDEEMKSHLDFLKNSTSYFSPESLQNILNLAFTMAQWALFSLILYIEMKQLSNHRNYLPDDSTLSLCFICMCLYVTAKRTGEPIQTTVL